MSEEYKCKICNDIKYVSISRDGRDYAKRCTCFWDEEIARVSRGYSLETFREVLYEKNPARADEILKVAEKFLELDIRPGHNIRLQGCVGTGKTTLARILCSTSKNIRKRPQIKTEAELRDMLADFGRGDCAEYLGFKESRLIVLDDLGSMAELSPSFQTRFLELLDTMLPVAGVIVTSNVKWDGLGYDPRIMDRLKMNYMLLPGSSLRG